MLSGPGLVVVGSGLFGLTVARQVAELGIPVAVIERRAAIGGNARSDVDPATGIEVHTYGSHLFHTSDATVWDFVNRFTTFTAYEHRVLTVHDGTVYPLPISLATINQFFRTSLGPDEARALIAQQTAGLQGGDDLESHAISLVGQPLYDAFIRGYTHKQWQTDPRLLPASTISRLPVRFTYDTSYFSDRWQGLPVDGYTAFIERLAEHELITVRCGTDWLSDPSPLGRAATAGRVPVVFTGALDAYFGHRHGALGWRTLDFDWEVRPTGDHQGTSVLNYADLDVPWTRVHEFRHLHPERTYPGDRTIIAREHSRFAVGDDEPYYPVASADDRDRLLAYRSLVAAERGVWFGGRLGSYRYLDMHVAIASALGLVRNHLRDVLGA